MIVYWTKNEIKNEVKNNIIETIIYPNSKVNSILNNSDSMEFYELNESSNDNTSFLNDDSDFIFDICKEIDNNNISETRINSNDEIKIEIDNKNKIALQINLDLSNNKPNGDKIVELFNLYHEKNTFHEFLFNHLILNIINIINNNSDILKKLFGILSKEEKEILTNEILKNTQELIINENGYFSLLFLINLGKIYIINSILYFILQNFILYCINDYSSKIIIKILSMGLYFSRNCIIQKIKENYDIICMFKNGINILKNLEKYF